MKPKHLNKDNKNELKANVSGNNLIFTKACKGSITLILLKEIDSYKVSNCIETQDSALILKNATNPFQATN